jgi:hypothetical protein
MELHNLLKDAKSYITGTRLTDGFHYCGVRNMGIAQTSANKNASCSVVEPLIGLVLQGSKAAQYGTERVQYFAGDVIVVGQALPMTSVTVDATPEKPYIALYVGIDMQVMRSVYSDMQSAAVEETGPAIETGQATD